jgi:hypothetical protein
MTGDEEPLDEVTTPLDRLSPVAQQSIDDEHAVELKFSDVDSSMVEVVQLAPPSSVNMATVDIGFVMRLFVLRATQCEASEQESPAIVN